MIDQRYIEELGIDGDRFIERWIDRSEIYRGVRDRWR